MTLDRSLHSLRASHQTCQLPRSLGSLEIVQSIADLRSAESELRRREDITVTWLGDSVVLHEVTRIVFAQNSPTEKDTFAKHAGK